MDFKRTFIIITAQKKEKLQNRQRGEGSTNGDNVHLTVPVEDIHTVPLVALRILAISSGNVRGHGTNNVIISISSRRSREGLDDSGSSDTSHDKTRSISDFDLKAVVESVLLGSHGGAVIEPLINGIQNVTAFSFDPLGSDSLGLVEDGAKG